MYFIFIFCSVGNQTRCFMNVKHLVRSRVSVVHAFNASTQKTEANGSLPVQGQPGLQSEFQDSQGHTEKPCFEKKNCLRKKKRRNRSATEICSTPTYCTVR